MPTIPAQTFDGYSIPQTVFKEGWTGQTIFITGQFTDVSYATYQSLDNPNYYMVILASDTRSNLPSGGSIIAYTYDGKTAYLFTSTNVRINTQYTPPLEDTGNTGYPDPSNLISNRVAWLMVYGEYTDGYRVTYDLVNCTGDENNPTIIRPESVITNANFTPNPGYYFSKSKTIIYGTGLGPEGGVVFTFNTSTGEMRIGAVTSDIRIEVICDGNPYSPGGNSGGGGGGGTFDFGSDTITLPPLPTTSFAATGFTRIYNPTLSELNALANYMWTDQTFLDTVINHLKQLLENPMDAVICLSLLPCQIPNGTPEPVKVMFINTGVSMAPATTQFVEVDCGTYTINEAYGSALDYNPYTKVHCYLPYIGQVTLDTDEVMGKTLQVKYRIDIVTGMCAAIILVDQTALYQFSGHCSINMPINSADFSGYIGAAMTAGKMVAGVVAGASGNLPLAAELIGAPAPKVTSTSKTTETVKSRNPKTGRQVTQWSDTKERETMASGASFGEMTRKAAANTVGAVMGSKLTVEHAGGFTGNSGYLAVRRPYLIIEHPRMCNPDEYGDYNGYPSMIYMSLNECEGYTEVQSIQLNGISATNPELAELSELLKTGVIF